MRKYLLLVFTAIILCISAFSLTVYASEDDESSAASEMVTSEEETADTEEDAEETEITSQEQYEQAAPNNAEPLFEFNYGGKNIKTYGSYSLIDDRICTTHRFFVKNGKLTVVDQNLNPTPTGVFIHYDDGDSYIVVLSEDGTVTSLGTRDELKILQDFKNGGIKSLSENITKDSSTLLFEYNDGGIAAYDCVTGELIFKQEGNTPEPQGIASFISGAVSDFLNLFSFNNPSNPSAENAQNVINALQESGVSVGEFAAMQSELPKFESSQNQDTEKETADPAIVTSATGEVNSILSENRKLTDSEQEKINKILLQVANGEKSTEDALNEIRNEVELSESQVNSINIQLKNIYDSRVAAERSKADVDAQTYSKGSYGTSGISGKDNSGSAYRQGTGKGDGTGRDIVDGKGEGDGTGEGDNAKKAEAVDHQFIKSDISEDYVAVYNAEEGRYDIYSAEDLLENPEDAKDGIAKISDDTDLETITRILAHDKDDSARRGIILYVGIALAICGIIASMIIFGRKKEVVRK